ncbi:MAG: hypothetical protein KA027_03485 [Candidatus Methanofastidiosum sp.]|nr:hypothetical protein [Methanofastidiosum sp.]
MYYSIIEKNTFKYTYYILFLIQLVILAISILLLLNIFNTSYLFKDSNTSSLILRIILYLFFQLVGKIVLERKGFEQKRIYSILALISISIILDELGYIFGWYEMGGILGIIQYDDILHFFLPMILTISLNIMFLDFLKKKNLSNILSITTLSFLISIWEIYEYWSDRILKTTMFGDIHDTILDMTLGIFGGIIAIILLRIFKGSNNI